MNWTEILGLIGGGAGIVALAPQFEHASIGERKLHECGILLRRCWIRRYFAIACAHDGIATCENRAEREIRRAVGILLCATSTLSALVAVGLWTRARPSLLDGDVLVEHELMVSAIVQE